MADGDLANALLVAGNLMDGGVDPRQLTRQLSGYWRDALVGRSRQKPVDEPSVARCLADQIVPVLYTLMSVETGARRSDSPRWALEAAIAEATLRFGGELSEARREPAQVVHEGPQAPATAERVPASREAPRPSTAQPDPQPQPPAPVRNAEPLGDVALPAAPAPLDAGAREAEALAPSDPKTHQSAPIGQKMDVRARWPMVLRRLHEINKPQVHTLLQKVAVDFIETDGQVLALPFRPNDFWLGKRLETTTNRRILEDAVSEVLGGQWSIRCVTIDEPSVRRGDLADLEYLEQMAAEAKALGGEREHDI
jgi:hypothetical protein